MMGWISDTTWGYPVVSAIHVLVFVLIGATVLVPSVREETRWLRWIGLSAVVVTGVLLFMASAAGYWKSTSFRIKLVLLAVVAVQSLVFRNRVRPAVTFALWTAIIFASRGIAFY
jgi:hypothetical protein